jgi:toxin-antitoxin system PIN domain toxin
MTSSSFPDVNVWLAMLAIDHVHREPAQRWWNTDQSDRICFTRFTQVGVLRLLTTAAVMNGKPLTMSSAWSAYDWLFADNRVTFLQEPVGIDAIFRAGTSSRDVSPKVWADAYLIAFAAQAGGRVITFDRGLASRARESILLA